MSEIVPAYLNSPQGSEPQIVCIVCRCTDTAPCFNACFWTWMNELTGAGLCSNCSWLSLEELQERLDSFNIHATVFPSGVTVRAID